MYEQRPSHGRIGVVGPIIRLAGIVTAAILFNSFPQIVGTYQLVDGTRAFQSSLAPAYRWFLPALNVWWAAVLGLNVTHLVLRRWTELTRWLDLAVHVFGAAVCFAMATVAPSIAFPNAVTDVRAGFALVGLAVIIRPATQILPRFRSGRPVGAR